MVYCPSIGHFRAWKIILGVVNFRFISENVEIKSICKMFIGNLISNVAVSFLKYPVIILETWLSLWGWEDRILLKKFSLPEVT